MFENVGGGRTVDRGERKLKNKGARESAKKASRYAKENSSSVKVIVEGLSVGIGNMGEVSPEVEGE